MAIRVIDDSKLNAIAVAIQSKDNGGQMTVDEMAGRIEAIPTGSDFDMTVADNQVKMVIEVNDYDLSFWTRFGISGGGTVTVDWGDRTVESFTGDTSLEYATQRKHDYQEAGKYLITETVSNGTLIIGTINDISALSEGKIDTNINSQDIVRYMYAIKVKEISIGNEISVYWGLRSIPFIIIHSDIDFSLFSTGTNFVKIKEGTATIGSLWFNLTTAYSIKIPSSITLIENNAFAYCRVRIIDFTDIHLNENNELPFTVATSTAFQGSQSTIILFATQEIAEVAKVTTNLSQHASRIKYVGEV